LQNFQKFETGHVINVKRDKGEIFGDVGIEVQPAEDQEQQEIDGGDEEMQGLEGDGEEEDDGRF
jgi:hypothetical protein